VTDFTERSLLTALAKRHEYAANGGSGRYAFLTHVRTGAAFDQQEIDAVVVALWPSEHHDIHAFEVKCSHSDWVREIRPDTYKSERTREIADTFTVVAPKGVVRDGELPEGWGLLEATLEDDVVKLRQAVKAKRLRGIGTPRERAIPRGLLVAMLRAAGAVPGMTTHTWRAGAA
jgi:hypothetical protein